MAEGVDRSRSYFSDGAVIYLLDWQLEYIEIANTIDLGIFAISATYLTYLYKKRKQKYCHVAVIHLMELVGVVAFIQLLKLI